MALKNIFKHKKEEPKKEIKKEIKKEVVKKPSSSKLAYKVIEAPHITEKATVLAESNKYVFKVFPRTNKVEIKKAIEDLYGVEVIGVNIIKVPRKRKRIGRTRGFKKGYKKAVIEIKKGQKIEITAR